MIGGLWNALKGAGGATLDLGGKTWDKFSTTMDDPNVQQYLGGAGSKFGQGLSAGEALDPSDMISRQQEQQAIRQILGGGGGQTIGGQGIGVAPSGQTMLPLGGTSKLGSVLGGAPVETQAVETMSVPTTGNVATSPLIQGAPESRVGGGDGGDMVRLIQQLGGGMRGEEAAPTPIGTAGPDSVTTKRTADGTTQTVITPSERNLSTFGTTAPPEATPAATGGPIGGMLPLWKALLGM